MLRFTCRGALGAAALVALSTPAFSHVTLQQATAAPGSTYRAVLQINHGCGGAATTAITATLPDGLFGARAMPKAGWTLATTKAAYAKPYRLYGEELSQGVHEISWTGGSLPDDEYDELVFVAHVAPDLPPDTVLYVPVVQTCGDTVRRWVGIPAAGQSSRALKEPAPGLRVAARGDAAAVDPMAGHDMSAMNDGGGKPAGTTTITSGSLTIETPWIRATPGGAKVAGGYARITNAGAEPDRLMSASIPLAGHGEIHQMAVDGGVMKMSPVEGGLVIAPGATVELKPGGYHVMFMDLTGPAQAGEVVRGALTFAKAGIVPVTFQVGGLGAQSSPASSH